MSAIPTSTEPDLDVFFIDGIASDKWVLVGFGVTEGYKVIGPFDTYQDAEIMRNAHFQNYFIVELEDPEDVLFEQGAHG